jgi:hypothetical protein
LQYTAALGRLQAAAAAREVRQLDVHAHAWERLQFVQLRANCA